MTTPLNNQIVKNKCQRFTPNEVVFEMLQMSSYDYKNNIIGKRILENSFGNGNVLLAIINEYYKACADRKLSANDISNNLSRDIYGIELDEDLFVETVDRLNSFTDSKGIPRVKWHLYNEDALFWKNDCKFDYIIGNPPYIAYSELDKDTRDKIREVFLTCKVGKFDYCYAFIESAIDKLSSYGKLVQLIPNNIYKNVFADRLRSKLRDHISLITMYPSQQLFGDVLTSTSIFLYDKTCDSDTVKCINKTDKEEYTICRKTLRGKWLLSEEDNKLGGDITFGSVFKVSSSVATLLNEAFIVSKEKADELEYNITRPAVSPKSLHFNRNLYVIFPYYYSNDGGIHRFEEKEFIEKYPRAAAHLSSYRKQLDERAADKKAKWFEYGRSQALKHINQEKLLMSTVITDSIILYRISAEEVPYTGLYIVPINNNYDLADAEAILTSKDFLDYIKRIGISVNGKSVRITSNDVKNYRFYKEDLKSKV